MTTDKMAFLKDRFHLKYNDGFEKAYKKYLVLKPFAPDGNVFESGQSIDDKTHYIMRLNTEFYLTEAFKAMKMDLSDPNVKIDLSEGNIGTAGRLAKVFCGSNTHDDTELGSGRWAEPVRIASFPNKDDKKIPITKRIDIISNCSHHFITFSSLTREDSYALISYIPKDKVLGISKLQRVANNISQRFWLQENLTRALYNAVSEAAETEDVYVKLVNIVHGCEYFRGARSNDGAFSSEYYSGAFNDASLRDSVSKG